MGMIFAYNKLLGIGVAGMNIKRAIVTGATGVVGTALVKELISNGVEVLIFCRERSRRNILIPEHPLVKKICVNLEKILEVQNSTGKKYDIFYHLAWQGTTGSERNNMHMQNQNVRYALDAVEVAKRFGCNTFIGAGSQAEYGRVEGILRGDTPTFPETGYGIGKLCAGQMTKIYAHQLGIRHIWVRILSVYGPNDGMQSMVMSTITKLINCEIPQFTKGEQMWDYLYSDDAAKAFYMIGKEGRDGKTYVLGSGKAKQLVEYIETIRDIVSPNSELDLGAIPYDEKQVMFLCADVSELEKDTGWKTNTNFADGIKMIMGEIL